METCLSSTKIRERRCSTKNLLHRRRDKKGERELFHLCVYIVTSDTILEYVLFTNCLVGVDFDIMRDWASLRVI